MKSWTAVALLAAAQFVMVLDSSVMNVAISQIVEDLDTTIEGVQFAITAYTLVMAAFMLVGAKIGDIIGRERAFAIGLVVYACGSFITAISPNLAVLLFGWSLIEGLGAVLVVPAIAALIAANYEGKERAFAYGLIGGVAAAAVAAGPLIGGWVTVALSWRVVFVGEVVIVIMILLLRHRLKPSPKTVPVPKLDVVGGFLSASGLALIVFGILQSSDWGWVRPKNAPVIAGNEITPLGFSVVPFLILGGLGLLALFAGWEERREREGRDSLLDLALLRIETLRAGLSTLVMQQLVLLGTFFILPVYLQTVLGLDAFETGKRMVPMSVAMLVAALLGPRLAARFAPRRVAQAGLLALTLGAVMLLASIDVTLEGMGFALGLAVFGVGAGLLASQVGNIIMSSVEPAKTNEAGGLQGTAQNLGSSLGTALIGAILISGLAAGFATRIEQDDALPADLRVEIAEVARTQGLAIIPVEQAEALMLEAGVDPATATIIADDYAAAQLDALRVALGGVALFAVLALWFTRKLPMTSATTTPAGAATGPPLRPEAATTG